MSLGHEDNVIDRISEGDIPSQKRLTKLEELKEEKLRLITENSRNYLNLILKQNLSIPIRVQSLQVIGGEQFRKGFLARQLQPLLNNDKLTLLDFLSRIDTVKDNFLNTLSISNMGLQIDQSYFKTKTPRNGIELITNIHILPVKKYFLKIGTNVGNGEGDGYLTFLYRNIFGGAESLTLDTTIASNSLNLKNRSTYLLNFSTPFWNNPNWKLENIVFQSNRSIDYMCNHEQMIKGFNNRISSQYRLWNHEFSVENVLRTVTVMGNSAYMLNDDMLVQSGDNLKSSVNYSLSYDSRDDRILPTRGTLFKNSIEISMLQPFIKNQLEFQIAHRVSPWNFINFSARSGYIHNLTDKPVHLMDRFYIGGPNDLRGYSLNGLGPKLMSSPIGGNFYYGTSLSGFQNLGKYDSFKIQSFINAGKLINVKEFDMDQLLKEPSVSCGIGLVYKHPIARFELNFVLPIVANQYDSTRKGLQYGIGLSFM